MFEKILQQGERKQIARATEVAQIVIETPSLIHALLDAIVEGNEIVRAHGAHALMQIGSSAPSLIPDIKERLFTEIAPLDQWEIQEQLLKILPKTTEIERSYHHAKTQLSHKSAIVKTCALQCLYDLSQIDSTLKSETNKLLQIYQRQGPKALQARARKLAANPTSL